MCCPLCLWNIGTTRVSDRANMVSKKPTWKKILKEWWKAADPKNTAGFSPSSAPHLSAWTPAAPERLHGTPAPATHNCAPQHLKSYDKKGNAPSSNLLLLTVNTLTLDFFSLLHFLPRKDFTLGAHASNTSGRKHVPCILAKGYTLEVVRYRYILVRSDLDWCATNLGPINLLSFLHFITTNHEDRN